jgi:hypothetical protein
MGKFQNNLLAGFPEFISAKFSDMIRGRWAIVATDYPDQNKKRGLSWEASREVNATAGQRLFSVIELGTLPVDLKSRNLGGSGDGLTGKMYRLEKSALDLEIYRGGEEAVFNKHRDITSQPEFRLYTIDPADIDTGEVDLDTFLNARVCAAKILIRPNTQNQASGFSNSNYGSDSVFDPALSDKLVLLEIAPHGAQWITAYLDIYEGELDVRLTAGDL